MKTKFTALLIFMFCGYATYAGPLDTTVSTAITQDLEFGNITADPNGGTIERYTGIRNISGQASFSGGSQDAQISITVTHCAGVVNSMCSYEVTLSTTTLTGPGSNITLNTFQPSSTIGENFNTDTRYANFGARITYGTNQTPGTYTGSIRASVQPLPSSESPRILFVPVSVEILPPPITINETQVLNFGQVIIDKNGGEIAMDNAGVVSNISGESAFQGNATTGGIEVSGAADTQVFVSFTPTNLTGSGATTLTLDNLSTTNNSPTIDADGTIEIPVTGNLTFPSNAEAGTYSGTYSVTINY